MNKQTAIKHLDQLTWLRGIAALLVLISHSIRATEVKYAETDHISSFLPLNILDLGPLGVSLFFTLSGCTLWISNRQLSSLNNTMSFYSKRFFRIWPAFFVSVIFYLLFIQVFKYFYIDLQGHWVEDLANDNITFFNILQYLSLTFNFTGPGNLINNVYWSLPVEFQFYLIFPLIIFLMGITRGLSPILIAFLLYYIGWYQLIDISRYEVLNLAYTFCGGILIGFFYTEKKINFRLPFSTSILISVILLLIASAVRHEIIVLPETIPVINRKADWFGIISIFIVFVFVFSYVKSGNSRVLSFLTTYGNISYSSYLFHNLFIGSAILLVVNFEIYGETTKILFTFSFALIGTYIFSTYTYKWIELPGIKLGKIITGRKNKAIIQRL